MTLGRGFFFVLCLMAFSALRATAGEGIALGPETVLPADGPGKGLQATPAVAFGKDVYLVAWREGWHGEGGSSRIFAARVDKAGKVLDAKGIEVAADASGVQDRPKVAFASGVFLVVWQELKDGRQYDVRAARVSPEGKVLDAKSIAVATSPENDAMPDVASDGQNFVVVWNAAEIGDKATALQIYAATVSSAGAVGSPEKLFGGGLPHIAWDGKSYLVIACPITGLRLDAAGKPVGKAKSVWSPINMEERTMSLGGGNGGWLVVADRSMPDYWGWGGPGAMRCRLLTAEGERDPGMMTYLKSFPNENAQPEYKLYDDWLDFGDKKAGTWPSGASAVAWDGKQYVAVWQRFHIEKSVMYKNCDLLASRVDGWKPLDRPGVPIAVSEDEEKNPAVASDRKGNLLCVFEKYGLDGVVNICLRTMNVRSP